MPDFGFVGPSYTTSSIYQDDQECINFRAEVDPAVPQESRNVIALYNTPGLREIGQFFNQAEIRGMRAISGGEQLMVVSGQYVYVCDRNFDTNYLVGILNSTIGPVSIVDNGTWCYIVDGANRYIWRINNNPYAIAMASFDGTTLMTITMPISGTVQEGMQIVGDTIPYGTVVVKAVPMMPNLFTLNNQVPAMAAQRLTFTQTAAQMTMSQISGNRLFANNVTGTIYLGQSIVAADADQSPPINTIITATGGQDRGLTGMGMAGSYSLSFSIPNGTVTAATTANAGTGYTTIPTITVDPPVNTQGEQAIVVLNGLTVVSSTLANAGTGYMANSALIAVGGVSQDPFTIRINTVGTMGEILTYTVLRAGSYTSVRANPFPLTQGSVTPIGSGATINLTFGLGTSYTIQTPGSGYLQIPAATVTGGGGTGGTVTLTQGGAIVSNSFYGLFFSRMPTNDGAFQGGVSIDILDNLFIYAQGGTQIFGVSNVLSPITAFVASAAKSGSPDDVVAIIANNNEVFILGERSTEIWANQAAPNVFIARVPGAATQHGCAATYSVARLGNTVAYLSRNSRGEGIVVALDGYVPVRLSTHAVETSIQNQPIEDARAFTYQLSGHEVYVITFPRLELTWAYDLTTQLWHKWQSWDPVNAVFRRIRISTVANFDGRLIAGDWYNGKIYILDNGIYTEDGAPIVRIRRAPHIVSDYKRNFLSSLQIYFAAGVGTTALGRDPQAAMRWSSDAGKTWSNEYWRSVGTVGKYRQRAIWRRMGRARDRVYELRVSDPVEWVIVSAELLGEEGEH